jgi:hypothetical protein
MVFGQALFLPLLGGGRAERLWFEDCGDGFGQAGLGTGFSRTA